MGRHGENERSLVSSDIKPWTTGLHFIHPMTTIEVFPGSVQLNNAVAYLWEIVYDICLATGENVSVSPGFEAFGLRLNGKKIMRDEVE